MKDRIKWFFAICCLITALVTVGTSWIQGFIYLLVGLFLIPPLLSYFERDLNITIPSPLKYIIVIVGILLAVSLKPSDPNVGLLQSKNVVAKDEMKSPEASVDKKNDPDKKGNVISPTSKKETISYKIEDREFFERPIKKARFDVRIEKRLTKDQITECAKEIMVDYPEFTKYFIFYWLSGMEIGGESAWAISHYNALDDGNLSVIIQGASDEQESQMKASSIPKGEIIGRWYDQSTYSESTITIFRQNGQLKFRQVYKDGSFGDRELQLIGQKYIYENDFGEFLKIEKDGSLGWYSENGRFTVANKF